MASVTPRLSLPLRFTGHAVRILHSRHAHHIPSTSTPSQPKPSPLATSSSTTLDDFDSWDSTDPLVASLSYATDSELIDAILSDSTSPSSTSTSSASPSSSTSKSSVPSRSRGRVSPYNLDWTSSVDPAFAFLALRQRPTFNRFIEHVRPRLGDLFETLRASGMHQLLSSDIMLRNGDPRVLKELLEVVAKSKASMRPSAVVSMYSAIRSRLADNSLLPSSGKANQVVASALMSEGDRVLLPEVFDYMYDSLEWSGSQIWSFLSVILYMARHDHVDTSLSMIKRLFKDGRIPPAMVTKNQPDHPEAKKLLVQSIITRTCLENRLYGNVHLPLDDLMTTLEQTNFTESTADLVLEICRTSIAGRIPEQVSWAGMILRRFALLPNAPPIPSSVIDSFLMNTKRPEGVDFYLSLPASRNPPSPSNFIRLARATSTPAALLQLLEDVDKYSPSEFIAQRPAFIECLIQAEQPEAVRELYQTWRESLQLDFGTMYSIVCYLTRGQHRQNFQEFVEIVIADYAGYIMGSTVNYLGLARAYRRAHNPTKAKEYLVKIDPTDRAYTTYMDQLARDQPVESYRLNKLCHQVGLTTYPVTASIVDAVVDGEWDALSQIKQFDNDKAHPDLASQELLVALARIRRGRLGAASKKIQTLRQEGVNIDIRAYKLMIERCVGYGRWHLALETWLSVANANTSTNSASSAVNVDERRMITRIGRVILKRLNAVLRNTVTDITPVVQLIKTDLFNEYRNALRGMMEVRQDHYEGEGVGGVQPTKGRFVQLRGAREGILGQDTESLMRDVERLAAVRSIAGGEDRRMYA